MTRELFLHLFHPGNLLNSVHCGRCVCEGERERERARERESCSLLPSGGLCVLGKSFHFTAIFSCEPKLKVS